MENNLSIVKDQFKELPNNIEAEQAVIGSLLVDNQIFDEVSTIISGENFYDPMHQKIFDAIHNLIYKGMLANPITLKNYFEDEKDDLNITEYLVKITKFSTSIRQALEYSKIIYDMFVRRELIKISEISDYNWGKDAGHYYLAEAKMESGDYYAAMQQINESVKINPNDYQNLKLRADIKLKLGAIPSACSDLNLIKTLENLEQDQIDAVDKLILENCN